MNRSLFFFALLGGACLGGCGAETISSATPRAPDEMLSDSHGKPSEILREARSIGADDDPDAASLVTSARQEIALADERSSRGDRRGAAIALLSADVDARLAVQLVVNARATAKRDTLSHRLVDVGGPVATVGATQ